MSSQEQAPAAIRLRDLTRCFTARGAETLALDGVSLDVAPGEVYGIVGRSGAGKSTLIRCVNLLERPDTGRVEVLGRDMLALDDAGLRQALRGIGMVFQHFNLLSSATVAENIAFPLSIAGVGRAVREAFFSGATYSELAARLRVPLGTMKSWIRRSLMQLKVCLEQ